MRPFFISGNPDALFLASALMSELIFLYIRLLFEVLKSHHEVEDYFFEGGSAL